MLTGAVCDANFTIRLYLGEIQKENLIMLSLITKLHTRLTDLKTDMKTFYQDISGATAIEYGLIAAGIAVAIIAAVFALGEDITGFFTSVSDELKTKSPTG